MQRGGAALNRDLFPAKIRNTTKNSIKICIVFLIADLNVLLKLSYGASGYLRWISAILPSVFLLSAFFYRKKAVIKYIFSAAALIVLSFSIIISNFDVSDVLYFAFLLPPMYAFLLPDYISPALSGFMLAYLILRSRSDGIPYKTVVIIAASAAFNGILMTVIARLMNYLIQERNKYREISSRLEKANGQLKYGVFHDPLTGLPNRNYITNEIANGIKRKKQRVNYTFAVAFIDLDRFKTINDSLGHNYGDRLLIEVGRRLKSCLRSNDEIARLGGDEFVIFLDDIRDSSDAERIIGRLLEQLKKPFNIGENEITTSASVGIVLSNKDYDMPGEYLRYADITMYRAKNMGKNRYEFFDVKINQHAMENLRLENDLKYAIQRKQFRLFYQPIISLSTNEIIGFEALLRWQHPELGMIFPKDFIPLAEETGLIVPIGKWVIYEACRRANEWQKLMRVGRPLTINVNLSPIQLSQLEIASDIGQIIKDTGIDPKTLHIEITESAIVKDIKTSQYMLEQIKKMGVRIYIDDFGTGYSSLSYLNEFPFDALKIDRTFVQEIKGSRGLLKNIIQMAHELNMGVIGEGIESQEQLTRLSEFGCECGQGYYFSRPIDGDSVEMILKDQATQALNAQIPGTVNNFQ